MGHLIIKKKKLYLATFGFSFNRNPRFETINIESLFLAVNSRDLTKLDGFNFPL